MHRLLQRDFLTEDSISYQAAQTIILCLLTSDLSTSQAIQIPIIGMGGIATAEDAIEFILAGASAVSVGAMNFVDPYTTVKVVEGIEDYMRTYHVENLTDLIGAVQ